MTERELGFLREHFDGEELARAVERVEAGEPLAYVIGEWYFWDETFLLNEACLVPRPDTEILVDQALKCIKPGQYFADLCCGSGCIGISVLKHSVDTRCLFADISESALEMAKENARRIGVYHRSEFLLCDIKKQDFSDRHFDMILSNPPYIRTDVMPTLSDTVKHEPYIALDGGEDGMDFYRVLVDKYLPTLNGGGYMLLEIGYDQKESIQELCDCSFFRDYGGNWRVAVIQN